MYSENSRVRHRASTQSKVGDGFDFRSHRAGGLLVPEYDVADEVRCRERRRRQTKKFMAGLDPARMADLFRGDFVLDVQKRDRIWIFEPRQVEIPEENDVRIENAISLVRQRDGRGDLEILLHMPAADRLCPQRPPDIGAACAERCGAAAAANWAEISTLEAPPGARSQNAKTAAGHNPAPADNASKMK